MSYFRRPRTTQERRKWHECEELLREYPDIKGCRRARAAHNLPNTWDDLYNNSQRSWKEHRDTQYKVKQEPRVKQPRPQVTYDSERFIISRWRKWIPVRQFDEWITVSDRSKVLVWHRVKLGYRKHKMPK